MGALEAAVFMQNFSHSDPYFYGVYNRENNSRVASTEIALKRNISWMSGIDEMEIRGRLTGQRGQGQVEYIDVWGQN